jgi:hypothetical protein
LVEEIVADVGIDGSKEDNLDRYTLVTRYCLILGLYNNGENFLGD